MTDDKKSEIKSEDVVVLALYKFVHLSDHIELKSSLLAYCKSIDLFGTILLAEEGINGTVAGPVSAIESFLNYFGKDDRFSAMECKQSIANEIPFHRMKVKLKKEIVSMGVMSVSPEEKTGTRVKAENWNTLISDPDVLLIDTRNQYEADIGSFKNAVSLGTETFRDFPDYVDNNLNPVKQKKVAMFCTGGIRCEKASAYLLEKGFEQVYQLDGGILKYLEEIDQTESLWQGECFVFDGRVSVNHALETGIYAQCYACRRPVSPEQMRSDKYEEGVSCSHCFDTLTQQKRAAVKERQKQVKLAELRQERHIGASMPVKTRDSQIDHD
jgi:UPF0176 protein